jgi:hypothetical protein
MAGGIKGALNRQKEQDGAARYVKKDAYHGFTGMQCKTSCCRALSLLLWDWMSANPSVICQLKFVP